MVFGVEGIAGEDYGASGVFLFPLAELFLDGEELDFGGGFGVFEFVELVFDKGFFGAGGGIAAFEEGGALAFNFFEFFVGLGVGFAVWVLGILGFVELAVALVHEGYEAVVFAEVVAFVVGEGFGSGGHHDEMVDADEEAVGLEFLFEFFAVGLAEEGLSAVDFAVGAAVEAVEDGAAFDDADASAVLGVAGGVGAEDSPGGVFFGACDSGAWGGRVCVCGF